MTYNRTLSKVENIHDQSLSKTEQMTKGLYQVEYSNKNLPQVVHIAKICLRLETRPNLFQIERTARISLSVAVNIQPKHFRVEHTTSIFLRWSTRQKSFSGLTHHQNHFQVVHATKKVDKASITGKQR